MTQAKDGIPLEEQLAEAQYQIVELKRALAQQGFGWLFGANNVGVVLADFSGRVWEANDYYLKLLGFTRTDLQRGRLHWNELTPPEYRSVDESALKQLRTHRVTTPIEKEYFRADGTRVPVLISGIMLPMTADRVLALVIDRREQKQAEKALRQSEEQFRTLAENVSQQAWMADKTGAVFWFNQRWLDYSGMTLEELKGWGWQKVLRPEDLETVVRNTRRCFESGETWEGTYELRGSDGDYRRFLCRAIPIRDSAGQILRWLGTNTDITEQLQAQDALRQANESLEERVQERTAELTDTVLALQNEISQRREAEQKLQAAYEQLNLKTIQLRALTAELTLTEQRERRRLANILHDHLQQLLVGAKLRIAVLARKGGRLIQEAAADVDKLLSESIKASRSLTAELDPPVLHERGLLAGLEWLTSWMRNKYAFSVSLIAPRRFPDLAQDITVFVFESVRELLFNTVKHGRVSEASVSVRQVGGHLLEVVVNDKGTGFEPARLKPASQTEGGFGLFSIRERVGLLGGRLEIQSAPGEGTRVLLAVPLQHEGAGGLMAPLGAARPQLLRPPALSGTPIRVVLADDHPVVREGLALVLAQERDIQVIGEATDGQEVVELARGLRPEVILMDVNMPRLSGVEATRAIHAEFPEIQIIGLSMFEEPDSENAMRRVGAADYRTKSAPTAGLIESIRACRASRRANGSGGAL